ncbi:hypothetical protein [Paraburkholderia domus]|uniref:ribosome modulation factor n=1 Tax=Paraburkholderia domus TaxID=2793075 RepID=UPI0019120294|nr:hypothetical protein [Paraburkholderia domus]MBK5180455.1 hypothetical protein [Burkholderia sp. R-69749]CAE6801858.1 hypothetical protein R69749_02657 [Paraburkholderia domus]
MSNWVERGAYREGTRAGKRGLEKADNPYPSESPQATRWEQGWNDGFEEAELRRARRARGEGSLLPCVGLAALVAAAAHLGGGRFYQMLAGLFAFGWFYSHIYLERDIVERILGKDTDVGKAAQKKFGMVGGTALLAMVAAAAVFAILDLF